MAKRFFGVSESAHKMGRPGPLRLPPFCSRCKKNLIGAKDHWCATYKGQRDSVTIWPGKRPNLPVED